MNNSTFWHLIRKGDLVKARNLIRFFYYALCFLSVQTLINLEYVITTGSGNFSPRWPVFWAAYTSYTATAEIVYGLFFVTALFSAFFFYRWWGRAVGFLGLLEFQALYESFGATLHHWDLWLWAAFFFVFLPDFRRERSNAPDAQEKFLTIFWGVQAFVLLSYSMAGMWKILGAMRQYIDGQVTIFSPESPALHVAMQFIHQLNDPPSLLGPFIIYHPLFAWPAFIAVLYLQFFAFWIAFKPNLHRLWTLGLVLFHVGVYLVLRIPLTQYIFMPLVLLADSPFRNADVRWWQVMYELPIFGPVIRKGISLVR